MHDTLTLSLVVGLTLGDCDFEDRYACTWHNVKGTDDFNWKIISGATGTTGTGPTNDHTTSSAAGNSLSIPLSIPQIVLAQYYAFYCQHCAQTSWQAFLLYLRLFMTKRVACKHINFLVGNRNLGVKALFTPSHC